LFTLSIFVNQGSYFLSKRSISAFFRKIKINPRDIFYQKSINFMQRKCMPVIFNYVENLSKA